MNFCVDNYEYPMIGFLAMCYFFAQALNAQIISKLLVAMH